MSIDKQQIHNIAKLAMLALPEEQEAQLGADMAAILEMVATMDSVDSGAIQPMAHPFDATLRLRADVVTEGNQRDLWLENAPKSGEGLFLVPKVIE